MGRTKKAASTEVAKSVNAVIVKSKTEVVMLQNVDHDNVLYKKGQRVTLPAETVAHFVKNEYASAVDVAVVDEGQSAATQSQEASDKDDADNNEDEESEESDAVEGEDETDAEEEST